MIAVCCADVGKQYQYRWVLKGFTYTFRAGENYVITGKNGSGKSTLIHMLSASLTPSAGKIQWNKGQQPVETDQVYLHTSIAGPYMELPEEFTFPELINFHRHFKKIPAELQTKDILAISGLKAFAKKPVKYFSSGMKQRAKLTLTLIPGSLLLLLDEPCSSLDADSRQWYRQMLSKYGNHKTIIVASNHHEEEYPNNHTRIEI